MEVKYQIQFADVSKISVKNLNEVMDYVEHYEFIIFFLNACYEVKGGISICKERMID